jgi:hypothetical protein
MTSDTLDVGARVEHERDGLFEPLPIALVANDALAERA